MFYSIGKMQELSMGRSFKFAVTNYQRVYWSTLFWLVKIPWNHHFLAKAPWKSLCPSVNLAASWDDGRVSAASDPRVWSAWSGLAAENFLVKTQLATSKMYCPIIWRDILDGFDCLMMIWYRVMCFFYVVLIPQTSLDCRCLFHTSWSMKRRDKQCYMTTIGQTLCT